MFKLRRGDTEASKQTEMEGLIGAPGIQTSDINLAVLDLPTLNLSALEEDFTETEIWEVIKQLPADKVPGLVFMAAISHLSNKECRKFHLLNQAFISHLPEKDRTSDISDYRPISLIHDFAKIFSKALACRVAPHLDTLIALNRSWFIKGRSIQDNFMLVSHSAKTFHRR